ncbi:MAG: hypothetical protein K6F33_05450 [Bacteroidales bacterium]|nr:hypothetical protein [Bacteroidales bacterium]
MKKILLASVAVLFVVLSACKPTPKEAGNFNDMLMAQQKALVIKYDKLLETFDTYVPAKMDEAYLALMEQVERSKTNVAAIPSIEGGEQLKQEVLNYISVIDDVTINDIEYLVRVYKLPENEFSSEVRLQWDARYKDVDARIKDAATHLKEVQAGFAQDFNLVIE